MGKGATRKLALWVIRRLRAHGFEALLAGGCVRDWLLGIRPADWDVATNATPKQIKRLFDHVLMVGAKFGVAMVIHEGRTIEVATFRSDLSYSDGRRPDKVVFSDAQADALRRDFTINGMFLEPVSNEVLDYVGGQEDLRRRLIRAIGEADQRFEEDYLRMLRAVRFAARLDFRIEAGTAEAIRKRADRIVRISGERIREELEKMLGRESAVTAMRLAHELGLADHTFGRELTAAEAWEAGMARLKEVARHKDCVLSLGAILCSAVAERTRELCRVWGASNNLRDSLLWLNGKMSLWREGPELGLADFKRLMCRGEDWIRLRRLWEAEEYRVTGKTLSARRVARRAAGIDLEQVSPAPLVGGEDLKAMGVPAGPRMGWMLRTLYELQLEEIIRTRGEALREARRLIHKQDQD